MPKLDETLAKNEVLAKVPAAQCPAKAELEGKIRTLQAQVAIIGLGYVGLPLAVEYAKAGFRVTGIEVDPLKVEQIGQGVSYVKDVPSAEIAELSSKGMLTATLDFGELAKADVVIVCVPTPLRKTKEPDISYILAAMEHISAHLRAGQLIVLESTTYPGTTDELMLSTLESTGKRIDVDFFLAFSPERVDPGNPTFQTHNIPKVIGGVSPASTDVAALAYSKVVATVFPVSSARVAETAKLLENTFRSINIALVNEIAQLCRALDVNVWEVIEAAATKPFGFMPFYPGPGIGGHCIPLDPHYLSWKARMHGFEARFIGLAEEVNSSMPEYVVSLVSDALNAHRKCVNGAKILVLGVAYKKDIDDVRESPALEIMEELRGKGADLCYHDPYVPSLRLTESVMESAPLSDTLLAETDCVLIVTNHTSFDYASIVQRTALVVDTRNATKHITSGKVVRL